MTRRYVAPALSLPQVSDTSAVRKWMEKVNNLLTVREGMLGDSLDQNVTFRDLFESGLTKEYIDGVYSSWGGANTTGTIPATSDGPANYDIPPAPTGLVVASGIGVNILQWTNPATLYGNHSYTEVWRSATNNLGVAVKISTWPFYLAEDTLGTTNSTYYYWIRFVSKSNKPGPYNAAAGAGTAGTTAYVVASNIFVTNLSAINADMGSITAGTITGGTIQTAASGARIVLNASDLIGYDSASTAKTTLSGATGLLTAVDAIITGSNATNIRLDGPAKIFSINSSTFGALGIQLDYNAGAPRAYFGDGANRHLKFDGTDASIGRDTKLLGASAYNNNNNYWEWGGESIDGYNKSSAGVGGIPTLVNSNMTTTLTTGGAQSHSLSTYAPNVNDLLWAKNRRLKFLAYIDSTPGTNQTWQFGMGVTSFGSFTNACFFRIKASSLAVHAVTQTNSAETETALGVSVVANTRSIFEIDFTSATSAKFYMDGVLRATLTTTLPSGTTSQDNPFSFNADASAVSSSATAMFFSAMKLLQDP